MALSQKTIDIIKSTVPVLEVHGVAITTNFYQKLFTNHPELLNIFNHTNQSQGRQQEALANMVYQAAKHIDQLEAVLPAVIQVAHKHRSLGIKPEHYPIVGENLLAAIKDVLGDAATDEIIQAWADAYGVIADVFISIEADMYKDTKEQDNGWIDFKPFTVVDKVEESDVITSFYLKPADCSEVPTYEAGQYITVRIQVPGEKYASNRQYTLSCAPGNEYFRISVKKEAEFDPNGKISTYLHDQIEVGQQLDVSAPAGEFVLNQDHEAPIALISGGVGVTPMMSMLETLVQAKTDRKVSFIHSARNENVHAFKVTAMELVEKLADGELVIGYEKPLQDEGVHQFTGFITEEILAEKITADTVCYVCGPVPFLQNVVNMLTKLGVDPTQVHFEFFGPSLALETVEA